MSPSEDTGATLESALAALEAVVARKGQPGRWEARDLLLSLGACLGTGKEDTLAEASARARAVASALGEAWDAAVQEELALACAEHVQSVDPRYLSLPNYDFRYTSEARSRLEDRLRAAAALGFEAPAHLLERVADADQLLAAHLAKRGSRAGGEAP